MDQNDRHRQQGNVGNERNLEEQPYRDDDLSNPDVDADLQKEGNLGNERNRKQPDTNKRPDGRDDVTR
jgi:hypothetical protein